MPGRAVHARRSLVVPAPPRVSGRDPHGQAAPSGLDRLPSGRIRLLGRQTLLPVNVGGLIGGKEAPMHPYLARQMSGYGVPANP